MKNNTSFLLVAATVFAGVLLSFGSVADFGTGAPQNAASVAKVTAPETTPAADTTHRIE